MKLRRSFLSLVPRVGVDVSEALGGWWAALGCPGWFVDIWHKGKCFISILRKSTLEHSPSSVLTNVQLAQVFNRVAQMLPAQVRGSAGCAHSQ